MQTALTTRNHDLDELRQEAARGGVALHQHGDDRALTRAAAVKRSLEEFARDVGLELPVLHLPSAWTGLPIFDAAARKTVSWLRCEMPSVKEQQDLFRRQKGLLDLKAELENARAGRDAVGRDVRALDVQYGGQKALATQIEAVNRTLCQERDRLRLVNGKAALLAEAISYLEQAAAGQASDECPLCGQATPELLAGLRRHWQESTQAQVALIQTRIQELNHRAQALKTGADRYREHDEQLRRALQSIVRCRKTIGDHLGKTLHDDDDPLPLLIGELDAIEQRGRKLQAARLGESQGELADQLPGPGLPQENGRAFLHRGGQVLAVV